MVLSRGLNSVNNAIQGFLRGPMRSELSSVSSRGQKFRPLLIQFIQKFFKGFCHHPSSRHPIHELEVGLRGPSNATRKAEEA